MVVPRAGEGAARHCWVIDPPASPGRWPGLLVEWRRERAGSWFGRVLWVAQDDAGPVVLEAWLEAGMLVPGRSLSAQP